MAAQPGEENVATLFGDVHYFYAEPTARPLHHRFDNGSYVYLFENATVRRARVEIANQVGTDDQDAFDGYLDRIRLRYSYKHHCMVSLTVGEVDGHREWHLPTYDPRNENKYHYKLHSLDIYFWTKQDALQFVNGARRVMPAAQVEILDEPHPPQQRHHQQQQATAEVSSVVQKLERAVISGSRSGSVNSTGNGSGVATQAQAQQAQHPAPSFAPPPTSAVPGGGASEASNFAPMAYNPAAPAAPETIRHREKTPPPPEDDSVNPRVLAAAYEQQHPFSPLPAQYMNQTGMASPPFSPGLQRASTMPSHTPLASPGLASPYYPGSPGMPPAGAGRPLQAPGVASPPIASPGLPPPPGGGQGYGSTMVQPPVSPPPAAAPADYSLHQQMYRPGEGEVPASYTPKAEARGRLEENAGRLERGVSGVLKRFEKKFG